MESDWKTLGWWYLSSALLFVASWLAMAEPLWLPLRAAAWAVAIVAAYRYRASLRFLLVFGAAINFLVAASNFMGDYLQVVLQMRYLDWLGVENLMSWMIISAALEVGFFVPAAFAVMFLSWARTRSGS